MGLFKLSAKRRAATVAPSLSSRWTPVVRSSATVQCEVSAMFVLETRLYARMKSAIFASFPAEKR